MNSLHDRRPWVFAASFGVVAFFLAGSVVFYVGYRQFSPPPPPPGTALCGNAVIGGFIAMTVGAPVAAIVASAVGACMGAVLDCILTDGGG